MSTPEPAPERDPTQARQVEAMAGFGIPAADIAVVLGMAERTLRLAYGEELRTSPIKANARVAESLFRRATGEGREAVTAAIFWLKTRAGWRETSVHEVTTKPDLSHYTDEELERIIAELNEAISLQEQTPAITSD